MAGSCFNCLESFHPISNFLPMWPGISLFAEAIVEFQGSHLLLIVTNWNLETGSSVPTELHSLALLGLFPWSNRLLWSQEAARNARQSKKKVTMFWGSSQVSWNAPSCRAEQCCSISSSIFSAILKSKSNLLLKGFKQFTSEHSPKCWVF